MSSNKSSIKADYLLYLSINKYELQKINMQR